jgi:hypothetical protein
MVFEQAHTDRRDRLPQDAFVDQPLGANPIERDRRRNHAARDRRGSRPTISIEHITVDRDHSLAELVEIDRRPERASDQPLNLRASPIDAPVAPVTPLPLGIGARMHRVLRREPTAARAAHPIRHSLGY